MEIRADVGISRISKEGEEVCGDTTQVIKGKDSTTVILSDGLGSGIKASILSILSTRIASRLLKEDIELDQVFETIAGTLPICQVRGIAYSTLSILKIRDNGEARLIEYDNPSIIVIRDNTLLDIKKRERVIAGKKVNEAFFRLESGDQIVMVSDGVINSGMGGLFKLGLGMERLLEHILDRGLTAEDSGGLARQVIGITRAYYQDKPGDDSTCAAIRVRDPRKIVVITGPPDNHEEDSLMVDRFMSIDSCQKVVCGGATGNMVARELKRELKTSLDYIDSSVPPVGYIEGIDLVTEGILTLNRTLEIVNNYSDSSLLQDDSGSPFIPASTDGASVLADLLLEADKITFLLGTALNPAHKELMQSLQLKTRPKLVGRLINVLRELGKDVELEPY